MSCCPPPSLLSHCIPLYPKPSLKLIFPIWTRKCFSPVGEIHLHPIPMAAHGCVVPVLGAAVAQTPFLWEGFQSRFWQILALWVPLAAPSVLITFLFITLTKFLSAEHIQCHGRSRKGEAEHFRTPKLCFCSCFGWCFTSAGNSLSCWVLLLKYWVRSNAPSFQELDSDDPSCDDDGSLAAQGIL